MLETATIDILEERKLHTFFGTGKEQNVECFLNSALMLNIPMGWIDNQQQQI